MAKQSANMNPVDRARKLAEAGQFESARKAYKEAVSLSPNDSELLQEAGFVEVEAGNLDGAIVYMTKAVELTPDAPDAHINLAEAHRLRGNGAEALRHFDKVTQLMPDDGEAHYALADLYVADGQWERAEKHIVLARNLLPNELEILNLCGIIFEQQGKIPEARAALTRAIEIAPSFADALCNLAALCLQTHHLEEAIKYYEAAAQHVALSDAQLNNLYSCYLRLDMAEMALKVAEQLALTSLTNSHSLCSRGTAHRALGNFDAAERDYRAALREDMNFSPAYENLGTIHRLTSNDLDRIKKRLDRPPPVDEDMLIGYYYALYYGYRDNKDYEQAFGYLEKVNEIHVRQSSFDPALIPLSTDRNIRIFDKTLFDDADDHGHSEPGSIFIVGMPRSGTTLTERILAAHPKIFGGGERYDVPNLIDRTENYPEMLTGVSKEWTKAEGQAIHRSMFSKTGNASFVTDKLPGNFANIGLIQLLLPNAKIVYCKRNAMDNCLSCFEQNFVEGMDYTCSLEGLGVAYQQHLRMMEHWFEVCPISVHTVHYEDLVTEPEIHVRGIIGLYWGRLGSSMSRTGES